ncbi:MAG: CheB methylesterase domain-containing protein, partial [Bdellovibrionota bacterium]
IKLPEKIPPILIVQHIPPIFSGHFAKRLDGLCPFNVREASDNDLVLPGLVLVAPGGKQMYLFKESGLFRVKISDDQPFNRHKPSVDVLFRSVAKHAGAKALGVILTGMGADGAQGLLELLKNGAQTIAQNEESSVVFGMPKEAIKCGAVQHIEDLMQIPHRIVSLVSKRRTAV